MLSDDSRIRLNKIFERLWSNREGVHGSYGASSDGYHPTYIHRCGLLIVGELRFEKLYVVSPYYAHIIREYGNPRGRMNTLPTVVNGELIKINKSDPGPWWDILDREIPLMEDELDEADRIAREEQDAEFAQKTSARQAELIRAAEALQGV